MDPHPVDMAPARRARLRGSRPTTALLLALVLVLVGGCGTSSGSEQDTASAAGETSAGAGAPTERTEGQVTVTGTSVVVGDPQAPRVVVYQDLNCPHCRDLHDAMDTDLTAWAADEGVAIEHVVVDYLGPRTTHRFSTRGANLLAVVADADPEAWPDVLSALYGAVPSATTENGPSDDELVALAREAGADLGDDDAAAVTDLGMAGWVERTTAYAAEQGVSYIPQVFVDGKLVDGETHADVLAAVRTQLPG